MSHFSQVSTRLVNRKMVKQALEALGYSVVEGEAGREVRGFFGETQKADFKVLTESHYDIGFRECGDGSVSLVADWELMPQVSGIDQQGFLTALKREYARQSILTTAKEKGYEVQMEEKDGVIEMVVSQW